MAATLPPYVTLEKRVGETPLQCLEAYRATNPALTGVPMAYAGRLDPMASGVLLVLIGDTCKEQATYHGLDKAYEFSIVCGLQSDTGDVLGRLTWKTSHTAPDETCLHTAAAAFTGPVALSYPTYSSKTVAGKPLFWWALSERLSEITIPVAHTTVHQLTITELTTITKVELVTQAKDMIARLPVVTEASKALGADFRRTAVLEDWDTFADSDHVPTTLTLAHGKAIVSSGTYIRSLGPALAQHCHSQALVTRIHRTKIGRYDPVSGVWKQVF